MKLILVKSGDYFRFFGTMRKISAFKNHFKTYNPDFEILKWITFDDWYENMDDLIEDIFGMKIQYNMWHKFEHINQDWLVEEMNSYNVNANQEKPSMMKQTIESVRSVTA